MQTLGCKLNRRQRILDLVRDSPCDIGPRGTALVGELVGDVVERHNRPVLITHPFDRKRALAGVSNDDHIRFRLVATHELVEIGRDHSEPLPFDFLLLVVKQSLGGAVDEQDAVAGIERDNPCRNARQHGFHESPASIKLGIGGA